MTEIYKPLHVLFKWFARQRAIFDQNILPVTKSIRTISALLGSSMMIFGLLKFIDPFKTWYSIQIVKSGMSDMLYWLGIVGEIMVGTALTLVAINLKSVSQKNKVRIAALASLGVSLIMVVSIYVHAHPDVPGAVLPLKIKPPLIPALFFLLSTTNLILVFQFQRGHIENVSRHAAIRHRSGPHT